MDRPRHIPEPSSHPHPHHPSLFASLHRRTRTADPTAAEASREAREAAGREARRYLLQVVRNDWSYEPATVSSAPCSSSASSEVESTPPPSVPKDRDVLEWRLRDEDSSNSDRESAHRFKGNVNDPYRFESPDAVQSAMLERRRKRRKLIEEEMEWNHGLRLWMQRRDAWTGARVPAKKAAEAEPEQRASSDESAGGSYNDNGDLGAVEEPLSRLLSADSLPGPAADAGSSNQASVPPISDHTTSKSTIAPQEGPSTVIDEPLVPIVPPILPISNPFRSYTVPANYLAIYNKLVVEGNTPAVPVNLLHMTRSLVVGWKREGQWPPKPTITKDVPVIKKRRPQPHVESSGRVAGTTSAPSAEGPTSRRRSIGSNVTGAVKKVLGFASIPGHRFHVRGQSQSSASSPMADPVGDKSKNAARKDS
ncbi:predicted protein [Uncinocarpus reesii 1704]|uniref:Gag1-like clamp domain-containing protein n=1 Tax=Uncinocarpus reesii (strain UAMH 1704) TaxID=336963 RepID=C4JV45_UNCRE|nr:uncharacterized protein UREG_06437 [Uncinocarpus reesii 1704]EEP81572.1 predicted protein [Uncinocarpus reesii 1704]